MANFPKSPPAIGRSTGLVGPAGPAGAGLPPGWVSVKANGAVGNGVTDDSAAVQATIDAVYAAGGGTVYFPPGFYAVATTLTSLHKSIAITFRGCGGGAQAGDQLSALLYTGTATGVNGGLLSFQSSSGFEICYLAFYYNNLGFAGDLINIDGVPYNTDCQSWHIHHCTSECLAAGITARSIIRVSKAVIGQIDHCGFSNGLNAIRLGDPAGQLVNVVLIQACAFTANTNAHIFIGTADGESIGIRDCTFENNPGIHGTTVAGDGGQCTVHNMNIDGNWFGDTAGATNWISGLTCANDTSTIHGNFFYDTAGTHLTLAGSWLVEANLFSSGAYVYDSIVADGLALVAIGNYYNSATAIFNPANFINAPGNTPSRYTSLGNTTAGAAIGGANRIGNTTSGGGKIGFSNANATMNAVAGDGDLILGSRQNAGFETPITAGMIYTQGGTNMHIQAPYNTTFGSNLKFLAGVTPTLVLQLQDAKVGFYGAAPVTQAARAGQLTDSTGGTVTSTLAAGITDAVAKNAIASLAAKVNALETIIHNLGLSA